MLDRNELARAVDMQQRSYRLLKWIISAINNGFIDVSTAHDYATLPRVMQKWLAKHYLNIPADARPAREDIATFAEFFGTYLDNSFELVANPGKRLYSPNAHCFCQFCSWLVDAPHLKTRKVTSKDKQRAERLKADALARIALELRIDFERPKAERLLVDDKINLDASFVAYGYDLLQRLKGVATGPCVLALWRSFAWTKRGSPKPKFELNSDMIFDAEDRLTKMILATE